MLKNNPALLKQLLNSIAVDTVDHSCPVPASLLQSLASAMTAEVLKLHPTIVPVFTSPRAFGVAASRMRVVSEDPSIIDYHLSSVRHSNQSTFVNLRFIDNPSVTDSCNPLSIHFQSKFLRSTPSEWRLIVNSRRIRALRAEGYTRILERLYRTLKGTTDHPQTNPVLVYFSSQLIDLFKQAQIDIPKIRDAKKTVRLMPSNDLAALVSLLPTITAAIPILSKISNTISTHSVLPALSRDEFDTLSRLISIVGPLSQLLPLHHDLLKCLFPYIHLLVENGIILPVCPRVLDVYNHTANRRAVEIPNGMPDIAEPAT